MENQIIERVTLLRGPPVYAPGSPWTALRAALAAIVIMAAGGAAAVLALGGSVIGGERGAVQLGQDVNLLQTLAIWQGVTVALTLLAGALFGGKVLDALALRPPAGSPLVYLKAVVLMAAMQVTVSAIQYAFFAHDMYTDLRPLARLFGDQWLLALLVVGIGAPLSEELLFRGFLLSALAGSRVGFLGGSIITSTWWTLLHWGYSAVGIVEVFLIGLFFSWLLWRTGSLRVAIFCHALYNSLIVVVLRYVPLPP